MSTAGQTEIANHSTTSGGRRRERRGSTAAEETAPTAKPFLGPSEMVCETSGKQQTSTFLKFDSDSPVEVWQKLFLLRDALPDSFARAFPIGVSDPEVLQEDSPRMTWTVGGHGIPEEAGPPATRVPRAHGRNEVQREVLDPPEVEEEVALQPNGL